MTIDRFESMKTIQELMQCAEEVGASDYGDFEYVFSQQLPVGSYVDDDGTHEYYYYVEEDNLCVGIDDGDYFFDMLKDQLLQYLDDNGMIVYIEPYFYEDDE